MERIGVTPDSDGWRRRGRVTITSTTPTDDEELSEGDWAARAVKQAIDDAYAANG